MNEINENTVLKTDNLPDGFYYIGHSYKDINRSLEMDTPSLIIVKDNMYRHTEDIDGEWFSVGLWGVYYPSKTNTLEFTNQRGLGFLMFYSKMTGLWEVCSDNNHVTLWLNFYNLPDAMEAVNAIRKSI